jgi:hypothetical protein
VEGAPSPRLEWPILGEQDEASFSPSSALWNPLLGRLHAFPLLHIRPGGLAAGSFSPASPQPLISALPFPYERLFDGRKIA